MSENGEVRVRIAIKIGDEISNLSIKYGKFVPNTRLFKPSYRIFDKYEMVCSKKRIVIEKPKSIKIKHINLELKCLNWLAKNKLGNYALLRIK